MPFTIIPQLPFAVSRQVKKYSYASQSAILSFCLTAALEKARKQDHASMRAYTQRACGTNGLPEPQRALFVSYIQNNRSYNSRQALINANMQTDKYMLRKIPQTWKYLHYTTGRDG